MEDQPPVEAGELGHFLGDHADVVADQDEGDLALAIQVVEEGIERGLRLGVDAARRLVQDEQLGVGDEGARDEHALLLPRGQRADPRARVRLHADPGEHFPDTGPLRFPRPLEESQHRHEPARHDLFDGDGQGGIEGGLLRHVAEPSPFAKSRRRLAEESDRALRR